IKHCHRRQRFGPAPASALSASVRERYARRRAETLAAVAMLDPVDDHARSRVAELLHKLAGTAAMFGEAQLGDAARALEGKLLRWSREDAIASLPQSAAALTTIAGGTPRSATG
ncbi:MAG: Hpt domain-containing protein, partial [Lysobacteraceae bacterium]